MRAGHNRSRAYKGSAGMAFSYHSFFSQQGFIPDTSYPQKLSHFQSATPHSSPCSLANKQTVSEVSFLPVNSNEKFPWLPVITNDPRNKDSKIIQNATGLHATRKFKHVCQFLGPMRVLQVHHWVHKRKPTVLSEVLEAN